MVAAPGLKPGMVVMLEGELHGVASAGHHAGEAQQGSAVFARVKGLKTGQLRELRLHPSEVASGKYLERVRRETRKP